MVPSFVRFACLAVFVVAICTSCDLGGSVVTHKDLFKASESNFRKAEQLALDGKVEEAHRIYSEMVLADPQNFYARLELATFLMDYKSDPYAAIGELRAYLQLNPNSTLTIEAENLVKAAKESIAHSLGVRKTEEEEVEPTAAVAAKVRAHIRELEQKLDQCEQQLEAMSEELAATRSDRDMYERKYKSANNRLHTTISSSSSAPNFRSLESDFQSPYTATPATPQPSATGRTYKVQYGDTLYKIAQKNYGDISRVEDIKRANPTKVKSDGSIIVGTILVLPM